MQVSESFLWICEIFKSNYFVEHLRTVASALGFRRVDQKLELSHKFMNLPSSVTNDVKNIVGKAFIINIFGFFFIIFCTWKGFLKSDSQLPKYCFICLNKTPLKMLENANYFIIKALFVLRIFKFLSISSCIKNGLIIDRWISKFMTSQPD